MTHSYDCSIVIPLKNGEKYIEEALNSCIQQETQYEFEIIVCNDGSNDNSLNLVKTFIEKHPKFSLRLINSPKSGIVEALNFGIENANSQIIIRFDQDDLMSMARIQTQVKFMNSNPGVVLAGSQIKIFGERAIRDDSKYLYPETNEKILRKIPFANCFAHPAVAFRKDIFNSVGGYRPGTDGCEDYDLWLRMVREGETANLYQQLTSYRLHYGQHSYKYKSGILLKKVNSLFKALFSKRTATQNNKEIYSVNKLSNLLLFISILLHMCKIVYVFFKDFLFRTFEK
jgi:glycosyltransferase involved in cell wall biosynthesis